MSTLEGNNRQRCTLSECSLRGRLDLFQEWRSSRPVGCPMHARTCPSTCIVPVTLQHTFLISFFLKKKKAQLVSNVGFCAEEVHNFAKENRS